MESYFSSVFIPNLLVIGFKLKLPCLMLVVLLLYSPVHFNKIRQCSYLSGGPLASALVVFTCGATVFATQPPSPSCRLLVAIEPFAAALSSPNSCPAQGHSCRISDRGNLLNFKVFCSISRVFCYCYWGKVMIELHICTSQMVIRDQVAAWGNSIYI